MLTFYGYDKCGTCRKAKAFLKAQNINFTDIDITTKPPSRALLASILKAGRYKMPDLFNKSGEQYRALNMKDKIKTLSQNEALDLLSQNGRLVKRPIVFDGQTATVGFDEKVFQSTWK